MDDAARPLSLITQPQNRTTFERIVVWIPLFGWFASAISHRKRMRPYVAQLQSQLKGRASPEHLWGPDVARTRIARAISAIIAREVGWVSDFFIPDDPLKLLLFAPLGDGGEHFSILFQVEKLLGLKYLKTFGPSKTLGEFVDRVRAQAESQNVGVSKSS